MESVTDKAVIEKTVIEIRGLSLTFTRDGDKRTLISVDLDGDDKRRCRLCSGAQGTTG
mgnify:CR=1 FL=1